MLYLIVLEFAATDAGYTPLLSRTVSTTFIMPGSQQSVVMVTASTVVAMVTI